MTTVKVLIDACVLIPINLCDVFLRLAEADHWRVLAEGRHSMPSEIFRTGE
ncbi:hypothetical protein [Brevibacterium limosum]|uniref:hypothetical protein n=1 Tax=Brevibacterium limosum TaxID=2697565 RepID=UPI001422FD4A|nr:hypothetical protein [Brevibacterium limosum]